ncbi:hypothetical protein TWF481_005092 [Arthrobotrys musiformis]|uniref:Uncharacterized protein n=1 Tax=Arthrobotrys musiformis TaxID=47236 RepID=A0AAV9WCP5_9PEZI
MPVQKRRYQKDCPSEEPKRPEGDSPEPKRRQRQTASPGSLVTQGQSAAAAAASEFSVAATSNLDPQLVQPPLGAVQPDLLGRIYEMSSHIRTTGESSASDQMSQSNTHNSPHSHHPGGHTTSASNHWLHDGITSEAPRDRSQGVGVDFPNSFAGTIQHPAPLPQGYPAYCPPQFQVEQRRDVRSSGIPQESLFKPLPPPPSAEDDIWDERSWEEFRIDPGRSHRGLHNAIPSLSSEISPSSPSINPPHTAQRPSRLGPPPVPPPGYRPTNQVTSHSARQNPDFAIVPPDPTVPRHPRLGPPPVPPASHKGGANSSWQPPPSVGAVPTVTSIRSETSKFPSLGRRSDRAGPSGDPRRRRGAMDINFHGSGSSNSGAQGLHPTMRENSIQASLDVARDLEAISYLQQHDSTSTASGSLSVESMELFHLLYPSSTAEHVSGSATKKGKQRQNRDTAPSYGEMKSGTRQHHHPRGVHKSHPAATSSSHDPTFRFSASKGYFEAIVPKAYFMNNPNTRPLSTTDPFFSSFPSDPDEITYLRGTRLATRSPTPEIHLDETPEQKQDHLRQVKRAKRKMDRRLRKNIPLSKSWHLRYSSRPRSIASREATLANLAYFDDLFDDPEFNANLEKIRGEYGLRRRAVDLELGLLEDDLGLRVPIDELAIDPSLSRRSKRTAQPEEAKPLEVGREPEQARGSLSRAGPSSRNALEGDEAGKAPQGKKESRRRK